MEAGEQDEQAPWPARVAALAAAGALVGVAQSLLLRGVERYQWTDDPLRIAAATFLVVGGLAVAFTVERLRAGWALAFGAGAGLLVASVAYWNGPWSEWDGGSGWRFTCALLTVAIGAPFFQLSRDRGRWSTEYRALHSHAWTNVVVWFAASGFTLLSYALVHLLSQLFGLIGIDVLKDLLEKNWFGWLIAGAAFGGGVGLLRDRDRIVGLLQRVVLAVLSVLAPVLAAGLVLFLLALPFTGLAPLWESTRSTTPILLTCIIGAVILANDVIGNGPDEEARSPVLRWSGLALAAAILPLAVIAAVSTGKRIAQYGITPDRLWAVVFVAVATAYGIGYLLALVRRRARWADAVRPANVQLALGMLVLVAFLATPLLDFGALSARDQVARLTTGRVKPGKFDWQAMRFDYGPAGREALDRLAREGRTPGIRQLAAKERARTDRFDNMLGKPRSRAQVADATRFVQVHPRQVAIPASLSAALFAQGAIDAADCKLDGACRMFWEPGQDAAIFVVDGCAVLSPDEQVDPGSRCDIAVDAYVQEGSRWREVGAFDAGTSRKMSLAQQRAALEKERGAIARGEVTIRPVSRRQVFVGDEPVGELFE